MAYTLFTEVAEGRQGSVDQRYQRSYKRVFLVRTDSASSGPYYAGSHPSLPLVGAAHPEDASALCVGFDVSQDQGDPLLWRITVNYSYDYDTGASSGNGPTGNPAVDSQQQGQDPADRVQSPLSRPRDYQITSTSFPEAINYDSRGYQICNSAGDPFTPAAERQRFGATIQVGLNNATGPSNTWFASLGMVNASTLVIDSYSFPAKSVRLNALSAQKVYEQGVKYWRWSLTFEYRDASTSWSNPTNPYGGWVQMSTTWPKLGWRHVLLDQGKREWYAGLSKWKPITGGPPDYLPVSAPVLFDGSGFQLARDQRPWYKAWDIYEETTFPSPL